MKKALDDSEEGAQIKDGKVVKPTEAEVKKASKITKRMMEGDKPHHDEL